MYDLLLVSWSRSGVPILKCMICCRCLGLEVVPQHCTICCRCLYFEVVPQHKDVRFVAGVWVSERCPSTKMSDLLPVSWSRSGGPALRCTICCRSPGILEEVPQHLAVGLVANILISKWCREPRCTMYCQYLTLVVSQHQDFRIVAGIFVSMWCPSTDMHNLLTVSWSRSGAPAQGCAICCRCVSQH